MVKPNTVYILRETWGGGASLAQVNFSTTPDKLQYYSEEWSLRVYRGSLTEGDLEGALNLVTMAVLSLGGTLGISTQ